MTCDRTRQRTMRRRSDRARCGLEATRRAGWGARRSIVRNRSRCRLCETSHRELTRRQSAIRSRLALANRDERVVAPRTTMINRDRADDPCQSLCDRQPVGKRRDRVHPRRRCTPRSSKALFAMRRRPRCELTAATTRAVDHAIVSPMDTSVGKCDVVLAASHDRRRRGGVAGSLPSARRRPVWSCSRGV